MRLDQSKTLWRSSSGTPISSAITISGSSAAHSVTKSPSPFATAIPTMSSQVCWIRSSSRAIIRGVKPRLTRLRIRVWSGGSWLSMNIRCWSTCSWAYSLIIAVFSCEENSSGLRETKTTSSWRVSAQ